MVEAIGISMPDRDSSSRGPRTGARHYTKDEYIDVLLAHRDDIIESQGGEASIAAAAARDAGFALNDIVQYRADGSAPVLALSRQAMWRWR